MNISPGEEIAGFPATVLRIFFKKLMIELKNQGFLRSEAIERKTLKLTS